MNVWNNVNLILKFIWIFISICNSSSFRVKRSTKPLIKYEIWPRGNIPYFIDDFSFDKVFRDRIRAYLAEAGAETGLQFLEMQNPFDDDQTRWVLFINRRGQLECDDYYATNFTSVGVQRVVVGYDCAGAAGGGGGGGGLAAAVLALAGVPPQHNAPNRDEYIDVILENIRPEKHHLFDVIPKDNWPFDDFEYDFASAGHYDLFKYTKNGLATMNIKKNQVAKSTPGEISGLSPIDKLKIKKLYKPARSEITKYNYCDVFYTQKQVKKLKSHYNYLPSKQKLAYMSDFYRDTSDD